MSAPLNDPPLAQVLEELRLSDLLSAISLAGILAALREDTRANEVARTAYVAADAWLAEYHKRQRDR